MTPMLRAIGHSMLFLLQATAATPHTFAPAALAFVMAHQVTCTMLASWAFSACVSGLLEPDATSSKFYRWFYKTSHTFAGNLDRWHGTAPR